MGIYNIYDEQMAKSAIGSILNQTYTDYELIICDDGSTNNSIEMVKRIVDKDYRVRFIQNKRNMGLAYSLNHCLKYATGEYIARMDIDDVSYPDRLEKQVSFLDINPKYAVVSSWCDLIDDDGVWGLRKSIEFPTKKDFLFGSPIVHAAMLMRSDVMKCLGGYRVAWDTVRAEDYDLFMRLYAMNERAYNIQSPLYQIREDKQSYSRRSYRHRIEEMHVRLVGFKKLGLYPIGILYVIKPLIVGLIPQKVLAMVRNEKI